MDTCRCVLVSDGLGTPGPLATSMGKEAIGTRKFMGLPQGHSRCRIEGSLEACPRLSPSPTSWQDPPRVLCGAIS